MRFKNSTYKNKSLNNIPCKASLKLINYGSFIVLCQSVFLLLRLNILMPVYEHSYLYRIIFPEFEYPLINIALIICGVYLIDMHFLRYSK